MTYVQLYTRQHENSIFELVSKGYICNKEIYIKLHMREDSDYFIDRYRYFVKMAEKRVPRPDHVDFPIWCSISKRNCLKPSEGELVYVVNVPKDQIIYFDGRKWDKVLNYLYIAKDEKDQADYDDLLNKHGIDTEHFIFNGKYKRHFPFIEKKIENSWQRIFDIDEWNDYYVQANLWEIKEDWVKRIVGPDENLYDDSKGELDINHYYQLIKSKQSLY